MIFIVPTFAGFNGVSLKQRAALRRDPRRGPFLPGFTPQCGQN